MTGIIVDLGTGDGTFTYRLAQKHPDKLIIGIDPHHKGLEKISTRIYKKASRGGVKNVLFVLSDAKNLPLELKNLANQVFINFPWGSLLRNLVCVESKLWDNIRLICQKGALIDIILGYDERYEKDMLERENLPILNLDYLKDEMKPKLNNLGFRVLTIRPIKNSDLKNYPSCWAKKLAFGKNRQFFFLRAQKV